VTPACGTLAAVRPLTPRDLGTAAAIGFFAALTSMFWAFQAWLIAIVATVILVTMIGFWAWFYFRPPATRVRFAIGVTCAVGILALLIPMWFFGSWTLALVWTLFWITLVLSLARERFGWTSKWLP
jgi:hypothetical protein